MKLVDCGHEFMTMGIICSSFVVKIRPCGHKIGTFLCHFTVHGMIFASCVPFLPRILLPMHKKFCTCGGFGPLPSPSHHEHRVFLASPRAFQDAHAHSSWSGSIYSLRSTPWAVGCTPHLWQAATVCCQYGVAAHQHSHVGWGRTVWIT